MIDSRMTDSKVASIFKKQSQISKRALSGQYDNTDACWSFYDGDQMTYQDQIQFQEANGRKKRAMVNFNEVQPNVDAVGGFMAQNRRQAKALARLNQSQGQQLYSKNMNALLDYHRDNTHADQLESDQDLDMIVNGYGAIDTELSYDVGNATTMPNGEVVKKKLDPSCTYWDPASRARNIIDRKWCGYHEDYELHDALNLFQGSKEEDFEEVGDDEDSSGYIYNPYGGIYDKIKMEDSVEWTAKDLDMVRVYNHQWFEYETFYKAANPLYTVQDPMDAVFMKTRMDVIKSEIDLPGDTKEEDMFAFDPSAESLTFDESTKNKLKKEFGDLIEPIPFKRKVFYTAVISGSHVFTWFKSISQSGFSIKFKTGTWNKTKKMWQGMVNSLMEPTKYKNKALTELMFTIAANSKGGVLIESDAVEDIEEFERKWAKTDGVCVVNSGAIGQSKIMQKAQAALPTGLDNIIALANDSINKNGVDPAFMGDISREDQSGVLYKRRIRQVISRFARYFDSITMYQRDDCQLMLDLIPVWVENNRGATVRMVGEDGSDEFFVLSEDKLASEYDVDIQEAALSGDEKQETAVMLSQAGMNLLTTGQVSQGLSFISESLQFYRLDGDVRDRLVKSLEPQDDPRITMLEQKIQQLQGIIQSGQVEKTKSETAKNEAQAAKTAKEAMAIDNTSEKTNAETLKALEEARRTAFETDFVSNNPNQDNVNINL
jgi:hypothetical protein